MKAIIIHKGKVLNGSKPEEWPEVPEQNIQQRWILSGQYFDGTNYSEVFETLSEVLDEINKIQNLAEDLSWTEPDEVINPLTLELENDNTKQEVIELNRQLYSYS